MAPEKEKIETVDSSVESSETDETTEETLTLKQQVLMHLAETYATKIVQEIEGQDIDSDEKFKKIQDLLAANFGGMLLLDKGFGPLADTLKTASTIYNSVTQAFAGGSHSTLQDYIPDLTGKFYLYFETQYGDIESIVSMENAKATVIENALIEKMTNLQVAETDVINKLKEVHQSVMNSESEEQLQTYATQFRTELLPDSPEQEDPEESPDSPSPDIEIEDEDNDPGDVSPTIVDISPDIPAGNKEAVEEIMESIETKGITGYRLSNIKEVKYQGHTILNGTGEAPYINEKACADAVGFALEFWQKTKEPLVIASAYRTMEHQQRLIDYNKDKTYTHATTGEVKTGIPTDPVGKSVHNLGFAIDIGGASRYNLKIGGVYGIRQIAKKYRFKGISSEDRHFNYHLSKNFPKAKRKPHSEKFNKSLTEYRT